MTTNWRLRKTGTTQPSSTSPRSKTANGKGTVNAISSGSIHHTTCKFKTNIGKKFIYLIKKHFHKGHKLHKILNTDTIKLSYCCTTNMTSIIRQQNAKVLNATKTPNNEARLCDCRNKQSCPLDGKCLSSSIVYRAEVTSDNNTKIYYGASEGEFKTRYNNHTKSFRHKMYYSETELSRHIWSLKDNTSITRYAGQ